MRGPIAAFRDTGLFLKLFLAFGLIMVVPVCISYFVSERATTQAVINRVFEETLDSLEVVGNQIEDILLRMIYVSLYVNNDGNVRSILMQSRSAPNTGSRSGNLQLWARLDSIGRMFENLAFNVMRTNCYFTLVSPSGYTYTSWPSQGTDLQRYVAQYTSPEPGLYVRWIGLEKNQVRADAKLYPYVITLTKSLSDRLGTSRYGTLVVSIPEAEIRGLMNRGRLTRSWFMVDRDFRVMSGSSPEALGTTVLPPERRTLLAGPQGRVLTDFPGMGHALVAYRKMQSEDWTLITVESYASITT
jgi:hypothetical protein